MATSDPLLDALRVLTGRSDAEFSDGQRDAIKAWVEDRSRALVVQRTGCQRRPGCRSDRRCARCLGRVSWPHVNLEFDEMACLDSLPKSFGQLTIFGCPSLADPGTTLVMVDQDMTSYVQFPTEAILHTASLPDDGGQIYWLPADTKLTFGGYE